MQDPSVDQPRPRSAIRASNVHIPVSLIEGIERRRASRQFSNGELVIDALEKAYPRLADLISRREPAGGTLFETRATRAVRTSDGPLTPLNIRLREADFEVIDSLVDRFGAYSRGHLITVALTEYLRAD